MSPSLLTNPTESIALGGSRAHLASCTPQEACTLAAAFAAMLPWSRYPFSASALEKYLGSAEPGALRYVVRIDGEPAGALGLRLNWLRGPYIQFLGIVRSHQSAGLGAAVLAKVCDDALAGGDRNVWVAASDFNTAALRFYEHHGFTRAAVLDGLVQDGIGEVLLRKRL